MHYTSLLLIMLMVNLSVVSAQMTQVFYRVNFNPDETVLDLADKEILTRVTKDYRKGNYGELLLTAHTDADASDGYNMTLSRKRADAVTQYLIENGIRARLISVNWFGERRPEKSNADIEGKAINRRVDITLKQYVIHNSGELIQQASPSYRQSYTINPHKDNIVKGNNGTQVSIPGGSLQTLSGKPVIADRIQIVMEEFLTPRDAAFNQLATVSDGRMLESGGMFSVRAYAQDEELAVKKGKQLQVEMPTIHMKPGMELFTAVKTPEGITEWKPASTPFSPKDYKPSANIYTKLDTKYLNSLKVDVPPFDTSDLVFSCEVPAMPKEPQKPGPKPSLTTATAESMFEWYERLLIPGFIIHKKVAAEQVRREKTYATLLKWYNKRLDGYESAYARYINDSTEFERSTLEKMRTWLRERRQDYLAYIQHMDAEQWNKALSRMIYLSDQNELTSANPEKLFMGYLNGSSVRLLEHQSFVFAVDRIDYLLGQSMTNIVKNFAEEGILFTVTTNTVYYTRDGFFASPSSNTHMNKYPELTALFKAAQQDIILQREKAGLVDNNLVSTVYTTSISEFGLFNCDRFKNTPPNQMATITIPYEGDARVSIYIAQTNSHLYAYKDKSGYSAQLPKGVPIKIVFVAFTPGSGPVLSIQQTYLQTNMTLPVTPRSVTLAELQKELASL